LQRNVTSSEKKNSKSDDPDEVVATF